MTQNERLQLICVMYDILQQHVIELAPEARHGLRQMCNQADKSLSRLIKEIDKVMPVEAAEQLGDLSDQVRELIESNIGGLDKR